MMVFLFSAVFHGVVGNSSEDCNEYTAAYAVFLFDVSGTTRNNNNYNLKLQIEVAIAVLDALQNRTRFLRWGVVVFADTAETAYEMQPPRDNPIALLELMRHYDSTGRDYENYNTGLNAAKSMLEKYKEDIPSVTSVRKYVILLGDGNKEVDPAQFNDTYVASLKNIFSNILIASAVLPSSGFLNHEQQRARKKLFRNISCPDTIVENECDRRAIVTGRLTSDTVKAVSSQVARLFGDLVVEKNCEPVSVYSSVAPAGNSSSGSDSVGQQGEEPEDTFPTYGIVLAVLAALLLVFLCACLAYVCAKKKKSEEDEKVEAPVYYGRGGNNNVPANQRHNLREQQQNRRAGP